MSERLEAIRYAISDWVREAIRVSIIVLPLVAFVLAIALAIYVAITDSNRTNDFKRHIYTECAAHNGTWNEDTNGYWCSYPAGE